MAPTSEELIEELSALDAEAIAQEKEIELAYFAGAPLGPILERYKQEALDEYRSDDGAGGVAGSSEGDGAAQPSGAVHDAGASPQEASAGP